MSEIAELRQDVRNMHTDMHTLHVDVHRILGTRLTKDEFAKRLKISRRTLYSRIESGSVPRPRSDGLWLLADVIEWERA